MTPAVTKPAAVKGTVAATTRECAVCARRPPGFGHAVRAGLDHYTGDAVAIMMADLSDSHKTDLSTTRSSNRVTTAPSAHAFWREAGRDYPPAKLILNRIVNTGILLFFRHGYNDTTNAFKAYRREVIDQLQPLLSNHFNLTVEMPLKAVSRGCSHTLWCRSPGRNRVHGASKLQLHEMGSRYLFIVLYVWLEYHLSRGDYRRPDLLGTDRVRLQPGVAVGNGHLAERHEPAHPDPRMS